jgi:CO dehydrogenase/acetyl-CoA synthase beta subunit
LKKNKKIAMDFIMEGLPDSVKDKVGKCSSTKEIWNKLHNIYSKGSHLIIEPEHTNQNKEDDEIEREERCSSCQTDSEEEYCEVGIVDLEAELISALDELDKERKKKSHSGMNWSS